MQKNNEDVFFMTQTEFMIKPRNRMVIEASIQNVIPASEICFVFR